MTLNFFNSSNSNTALTNQRASYFLSGILSFAAMGLLSSCGGTGQDKTTTAVAADEQMTMTGVALDGPLARATVYVDTNNNSRRDPWESYAFTDDDGYYSTNPAKGINYCAAGAPISYVQYCLKSKTTLFNFVIRMEGGYDTLTGEPFYGQMSRRISIATRNSSINVIVSPITTLLTSTTSMLDKYSILDSLGLSSDDLDVEYVKPDGAVNAKILNAALKVQKATSILADRLNDTYTKLGKETGTPNDATSIVYDNLAKEIIKANPLASNTTPLSNILNNTETLARIIDTSEKTIKGIYSSNQLDLPTDSGKPASINNFLRAVDLTSQINQVVDTLIPTTTTQVTTDDVIGGARILETLVIKSVAEKTTTDTSIENEIAFINNTESPELVDSLKESLTGNNVDLSEIAKNNFNKDDLSTPEKIATVTQLPDTIIPFYQMGGTRVKVSDNDLGVGPNNLKDEEIEFYFKGDAQSLSGDFSACVKHIKDAQSNGTLGKGNTRGQLITGYWSLLGANSAGGKSYSLLLTINFLGTTYQAIMKPAGKTMEGNTEVDAFRFDNGGDFIVWNSSTGIVSNNQVPTKDVECEARLPSRVGI